MTQAWYHVQTPYHLLQAVALAAATPAEERVLVATPMHPSQTGLVEILRDLPGQPFTEILVLPADRWGWEDRRWRRRATAALNARRLRTELARRPGRVDVYTSNIQTVEGFALAYATKSRAEPGSVSVVEDGLGTYEKQIPERSGGTSGTGIRSLARRAYLGPGAQQQLGQMRFGLIDSLLVGWPAALEPADWPGVCIASLPSPHEAWPVLQSLARRAVPPDEAADSDQLDVLIVLPLLQQIRDPSAHVEALTALLDELAEHELRIGIKHHPREDPTASFVAARDNTVGVASEIPLELLLLAGTERLRWLVADRTTAIVSARRYRPNMRVASLPGSIPPGDPGRRYDRILNVAGTTRATSFAALARTLAE